MLTESVDTLVQHCAKTIGQSIRCVGDVCLYTRNIEGPFKTIISQCGTVLAGDKYIETAFLLMNDQHASSVFFVCRQPINVPDRGLELSALKVGLITAQQIDCENPQLRCRNHAILDLAFYDDKMLSLLLLEVDRDNGRPALILVPMLALDTDNVMAFRTIPAGSAHQRLCIDELCDAIDVGSTVDAASFRTLDNMKASKFAISGTRKVACVLFASRRRVRLFLMDVEDEDEDEPTDTCQPEIRNESRELTSGTEDNSLSIVEPDDENKENSACDTTADVL
jgi:anaphase-promoting complex subunit 4